VLELAADRDRRCAVLNVYFWANANKLEAVRT
jgi:hypothetical protein